MRLQCNTLRVGEPFRQDRGVMGLGRVQKLYDERTKTLGKTHLTTLRPRIERPVAHHHLPGSNLRGMLYGFLQYPIHRVRRERGIERLQVTHHEYEEQIL